MKHFLVIGLAALVALTGCSPAFQGRVRDGIQSEARDAEAIIEKQQANVQGVYRVREDPWVAGAPIEIEPVVRHLPELDIVVVYGHGADGTLSEAAHYLSREAGIPISVTADALMQAGGVGADGQFVDAGFVFPQSTAPLKVMLDRLTTRTGTSWREAGKGIVVFHLDTRTFPISVVPSEITTTGTITNASTVAGNDSGGGGGGGDGLAKSNSSTATSSQQTTSVDYTVRFYEDVKETIGAMLSPEGKVAASPSSATVTVRDTAPVLDAVGAYLSDLNIRLTKQVEIEMTVLTVDIGDSDSFGIDWDIIKRGVGDATVEAFSLGDSSIGGSSLTATIVDPTNLYAGSAGIIRALREQVNATVKRRTTVHAMNNQPVRLQTALQNGYIQSASTTLVANVGAQTNFQTGYQTTGFSLTLLPLILDEATVLLQVQGAISAPQGFRQVPVGEDLQIEIPDTSNDDFLQRAKLRSGATLVLTTLDQATLSETGQGVGSARNQLLGGSREVREDRRMLVILLTPRLSG